MPVSCSASQEILIAYPVEEGYLVSDNPTPITPQHARTRAAEQERLLGAALQTIERMAAEKEHFRR